MAGTRLRLGPEAARIKSFALSATAGAIQSSGGSSNANCSNRSWRERVSSMSDAARTATIVAKLRLEVNDPANCFKVANETPPDPPGTAPGTNLPAASGTTNYSEERCVADNPNNAKMLACGFSNAGLRIFDVRDPHHARGIAYRKPGAMRTKVLPASGSWAPDVDRTVEKISGWARWVVAGKGKGHDKSKPDDHGNGPGNRSQGLELQLWTVSDGHGFQVLRFTDDFKAQHKELLNEALEND